MARQRGLRAFSLIELLVVIAMITILAAILFPVFAQVQAKGRAVVCASNMKQLATAWLLYAQDYDETLPMAATERWDKGGQIYWPEIVDPYVKGGVQRAGDFTRLDERRSVFVCPD